MPPTPAAKEELRRTRDLTAARELSFIILRDRQGQMAKDLPMIFEEYHLNPKVALRSESEDLNSAMWLCGVGALIVPQDYLCRRCSV